MRTFLLFVIGLFTVVNLFGQKTREVINLNSENSSTTLRTAKEVIAVEGAKKSRTFNYNPNLQQFTTANEGDTLLLDFFDNRQYKAVVSKVTVGYDGILGISSQIIDYDFAACFISISKTGISIRADIPVNDEHYRAANRNGESVLSLYSLSEISKKNKSNDIAVPPSVEPAGQIMPLQMRTADDLEEHVTIDVMVVYTKKAKQWAAENVTSIDNVINMAFQYGNYVLDNSKTNVTLNMVYKYETDYVESADAGDDLGYLQKDGDGILDEVHGLRQQYGADLVVFMPIDGGVGYFPSSDLNNPYPNSGFSVSSAEGSAYSTTMIHEIGHNMGCGHHWQQIKGGGSGIFPYSSAWRGIATDGRWYFTIMSYTEDSFADRNPSTCIPYFSNPDVIFKGVPIGSIEKENHALTIKRTKHMIARYSELIGANKNLFEVNSNGVLTKYNGAGGYVFIPDNLGITSIGSSAFRGNSGLLSINIPTGISSVSDRAFENCTKLVEISFSTNMNDIGASAFNGCLSLNRIYINAQTTPTVTSNTFSGVNMALCNLIVPKGKKSAYQVAQVWKDFGIITEVHPISDFLIQNGVLKRYAGIEKHVTLPAEVTAIGDSAFYGSRIVSVTLIEGITSIGNRAFCECRDLQSLSIPNSVTNIGENAFLNAGVKEINVGTNNQVYSSLNGVLFNKDKTELLIYPMEKIESSYTIPDGVRNIRWSAFIGNYNLHSVFIPSSVTEIEMISFVSCRYLKTIEVSNVNPNYASDDGLLLNKDKTKLVRWPEGKLGKIIIPGSITEIGWGSLWNCELQDSVVIPASVRIIDTDFRNFRLLRYMEVYWKELSVVDFREELFRYVDLTNATLSVPFGTRELYRSHPIWKDFGRIVERDATSTEAIEVPVLKAYSINGNLYVSGLNPGEKVSIYNILGRLIYKGISKTSEINIPLTVDGIYIVIADDRRTKVFSK